MITANIFLGDNVSVDPTSSINNIVIKDNVRIAKNVSAYGSSNNLLEIGEGTYIGMNSILNGFSAKLKLGRNVSIAQNVNIMVDSGPNASFMLQRIYPLAKASVEIGDHSWIGASAIILPGVKLGKFCVVGAFSLVNESFPAYSVIGGIPAKLIRRLTTEEILKIKEI